MTEDGKEFQPNVIRNRIVNEVENVKMPERDATEEEAKKYLSRFPKKEEAPVAASAKAETHERGTIPRAEPSRSRWSLERILLLAVALVVALWAFANYGPNLFNIDWSGGSVVKKNDHIERPAPRGPDRSNVVDPDSVIKDGPFRGRVEGNVAAPPGYYWRQGSKENGSDCRDIGTFQNPATGRMEKRYRCRDDLVRGAPPAVNVQPQVPQQPPYGRR
jgi:hypothetical protein